MTLEASAGAEVAAVTLSTDNSGGGQATDGKGTPSSGQPDSQQPQTTDFLAGLAPENREFYEKKGWKSLDDAMKSHREAELLISKGAHKDKGQQPTDGVDPKAAEVPAHPSGYEFKLPEGLPENFPYDKEFAGKFSEWALNAKLNRQTAQALHDNYVKHFGEMMATESKSATETLNKSVASAHDDLVKAWGHTETPAFKQNVEMASRAMRLLDPDLKTALTELGAIRKMGGQEVVTNAAVLKALAKAGSTMFAEDALYGSRVQEQNPFDAKAPNLKRQGELLKSDPELAKTLIRAAGQEQHWQHVLAPRARR